MRVLLCNHNHQLGIAAFSIGVLHLELSDYGVSEVLTNWILGHWVITELLRAEWTHTLNTVSPHKGCHGT